jgi:outer membrane protein
MSKTMGVLLMKSIKSLSTTVALSTLLGSSFCLAYEKGDMFIRAGATQVAPDEDSGLVQLNGSTLSLGGGTSKLKVDDDTQLGLTYNYMLSNKLGIEVLAATPFEHTASGTGELAGLDIADIKHLPPTVSTVYYFDSDSKFNPYLGAGFNYTVFFDEDLTSAADTTLSGLGLTNGDVELDDSWGLAFQAGFDYQLNEKWFFNASVRWIDIDTEAKIKFDGGNEITADVEIDPFVYTLSVGYKL